MPSETTPSNRRILLIDDNESIHQDFRKILNPSAPGKASLASAAAELFGNTADLSIDVPFEIDSAFQGQEGLDLVLRACADRRPYAMAFVDLRMPPGWDGIETISRIWAEDPHLQVVICTAYSDYSLGQIAGKLGRTDKMLILKKPFDSIEVRQLADALTEKWRLAREARAKLEDLEERVAERTRELRERQSELVEARKLELVGKLAGRIAHDFNSLLTAIIGHADLIQEVSLDDSLAYRSAVEIGNSAATAATLTHQLLAYSRNQMLKIQRTDVNETVRTMIPGIRELMGDAVKITVSPDARDSWAMADGGHLEQVLSSLARNARDAMADGGSFTLKTADVTVGPADADEESGNRPGDYVMISVSDNGAGITDEVKPHLFEPYFTTKGPGQGKGLALATSYGVIKQMGGYISVESEPGKGATFNVFLPHVLEGQVDGPTAEPLPAAASAGGTEVILLVEENPALLDLAGDVLEQQGYTVRRAATAQEAMSIAGRHDCVDLLLADGARKNTTTRELAGWLGSTRPAMKLLLTSPFEPEGMPESAEPGPGFLRKPYTPSALSQKTRETLDAPVPVSNETNLCGSI
jgi:two-component system NtrC family sensor kinase